jgi:hypothetical protein
MKEDYLWDKTGEDAEIERLENALASFRYRETAPPALPAEAFAIEKESPRKFFRFGFAFAAFAAILAIFFTVWFQAATGKIPAARSIAGNAVPKNADKIENKEPEVAPVRAVEKTPRSSQPTVIKTRYRSAFPVRPNKLTARNFKAAPPAETLTREEKYAYDQLMLALSITSSSLRIVKDKVDGIEEKTAVLDTAK